MRFNRVVLCSSFLVALLISGALLNLAYSPFDSHEPSSKTLAVTASQPLVAQQLTKLVFPDDNPVDQPLATKLPASLQATSLPHSLDVYDDGSLVINKKIVHLFDFYLAAMGEEAIEVIVTRIKHNLKQQLPALALEQSLVILAGYLEYLNQMTVIKRQYSDQEASDYSLELVIAARASVIAARTKFLAPDVIVAFFEQADQYEDYMLQLAQISQDRQLNEQQKISARQQLMQQAPQWLIDQNQQANQLNQYRLSYQTLQAQGGSVSELARLAQQQFSTVAANRLANLASQRQQWQQRLAQYRRELNLIIAMNLEPTDQRQQVAELRAIYFSVQEVKRVNALDTAYIPKPQVY